MYYLYNCEEEIIKLKENLMSKTGELSFPSAGINDKVFENKSDDSSFVSKEVRRILNTSAGDKFENNIAETLKNELNFKETSFPTNFIYKVLEIENKNKTIIIQDIDKEIDINGSIYTVKLNKERSCSIIYKQNNKECYQITGEKGNTKIAIKIKGQKLILHATEEIQIDGIFSIKDFNLDMFDKDEIPIIFKNIDETKASLYEIAVTEMKYNTNKANNLISQIIKDSKVIKEMIPDKNVICLGFFDSINIDSRVDFKNKFKNIPSVIFGIKKKKWFGRNLHDCIDWKLIKDFKNLEKKVDEGFKELNEKINELNEKIDKLIKSNCGSNSDEERNEFLNRKRERDISSTNK